MGTSCNLRWREADDRELVWTVAPAHPIVRDLPPVFAIERQEMYGELFDIPPPDELVFISSFSGGEVFRSGCCFLRGKGRVFFFSPGHETFPVYHQEEVRRVLANAVRWACPGRPSPADTSRCIESPVGWFE
jgi:trehalose utilization protein